jgi:hypothetical protein
LVIRLTARSCQKWPPVSLFAGLRSNQAPIAWGFAKGSTRVGFSVISKKYIMHKLKRFSMLLGGLLLRLTFIVWLSIIVNVFYSFDDRLLFSLIFSIFWLLQSSKLDIKFILRNIDKWQFRVAIFSIYAAAWGMALFKYYVTGGFEKGLVLMFDILQIAPLSECFISIFINIPLNLASQGIHDIYANYFRIPVSILASFVVLELLLRLAKRILTCIVKSEALQKRSWIWVCAQLVLFVATGSAILVFVFDFSFHQHLKEEKMDILTAFDIVKNVPRAESKLIGKKGKLSRVFCAFSLLASQDNSKELFENLIKDPVSNGGKIYAMMWLFENDKNEYERVKFRTEQQAPFEVIAGDLSIKLHPNDAFQKIENGELKIWLNMRMDQTDRDACHY